jgi:maltooligosyltrehalose trehalohydrolase
MIAYLENHDQVANSATGERIWRQTTPGRHRAMTALLLLGPWTPLLFQGQEWSASAAFTYFADHQPELAARVRKGRAEFLAQFRRWATMEMRERLPDCGDRETLILCQLDWTEPSGRVHRQSLSLHRDLVCVRRSEAVIAAQGEGGVQIDGAVLAPECLALRFFAAERAEDDRLLLVNLGRDLPLDPAPEPLMAPPEGRRWTTAWSSEDPRYGGTGTPPLDSDDEGWRIPGHAAVLLRPEPAPRPEGNGRGAPGGNAVS